MDENNIWLERWENREIGFNQVEVNPFMVRYFSRLGLAKGRKVLVPLCGKTIDISWLLAGGHKVVGVELSEQAIIELFDALDVEPTVSTVGEFIVYSAEDITVYVGDIFKVTSVMLGKIDAIYDRAALVALTTGLRVKYAKQLSTMTNNAPQLLLCFEYDQSLSNRSPYAVDEQEVTGHYEEHYTLELLAREEIVGGFKGKFAASDVVWYLNPNIEIGIHDFASSSHSWDSYKIIAEPTGATHIFYKPHKYEHKANSKNPISLFGLKEK